MKAFNLLLFHPFFQPQLASPQKFARTNHLNEVRLNAGSGIIRQRAQWKSNSIFITIINLIFKNRGFLTPPASLKDQDFKFQKGNQVKLFFKGDDAFAAIREAIQNAHSEVLLETYILRDDETGRSLLKLLGEATRRGVQIKVLADGYGSWGTKHSFWKQMNELGIENRLFHPLGTHFRGLFIRDHRKIIIVDQQISFVGGMNIANEYGSSRKLKNRTWRDSHAMIVGSTAHQFVDIFNQSWVRAGGSPISRLPMIPLSTGSVDGLVLNSSFKEGNDQSALAFSIIVSGSQKRLWITNSYFAPNQPVITLLKQAALRGVDVRLLLQGPTDMPFLRLASQGIYEELLLAGIRIFEYQGAILHAKTLICDDHISVVGSSNLDYRSIYFNAECDLVMHDQNIAEIMSKTFLHDLVESTEIYLISCKNRSLIQTIKQQIARIMSPCL